MTKELEAGKALEISQIYEAIDSIDDCARMDIGVDPIGPRNVLMAAAAELESLRAKVAEIERQEPVGKVIHSKYRGGGCADMTQETAFYVPLDEGIKLYAAPVISPDSAARIAELEAEVARLRKIIDEEAADSGQIIIERDKLQSNLEASTVRLNERLYQQSRLQAENEALRKDAERLDFLDKNSAYKMGWSVGTSPAGTVSISSVVFGKMNVRQAIDAAIEQAKGGA